MAMGIERNTVIVHIKELEQAAFRNHQDVWWRQTKVLGIYKLRGLTNRWRYADNVHQEITMKSTLAGHAVIQIQVVMFREQCHRFWDSAKQCGPEILIEESPKHLQLVTSLKIRAFPRDSRQKGRSFRSLLNTNFKECEVEKKIYKRSKGKHKMKTQW